MSSFFLKKSEKKLSQTTLDRSIRLIFAISLIIYIVRIAFQNQGLIDVQLREMT
jgi:hypothetical protein